MGTEKEVAKTEESRIVVFQERTIRRTWYNNEWWFSVIDVVGVLSGSDTPKRYWSDLKRKMAQESGMVQPYEKIVRLKLKASDGKQRVTKRRQNVNLLNVLIVAGPMFRNFHR